MSISHDPQSDREQLEPGVALPGEFEAFDAQDLMAYPFFSLAKHRRLTPIDFRAGAISIRVEASPKHGMATIWDADVLIWAANRIVVAGGRGRHSSRMIAATPDEILCFVGRGRGMREVQRLKAALDRLQSTSVATYIRRPTGRRHHRFSWINGWKETSDPIGRTLGVELILPDWFVSSVLDEGLDLTIDREYFALWSGLERWLYRLIRKHRGRGEDSWNFDLAHLHAKSGSLSSLQQFAQELGEIAHHQTLPGYHLRLSRDACGAERLLFSPLSNDPLTQTPRRESEEFSLRMRPNSRTGGTS